MCSLSLLSAEIGKQPDKLIQRFFDILYSSPLLNEFELHLENNDFQPRHFEMMYQSWKKNSCGKKPHIPGEGYVTRHLAKGDELVVNQPT